ncbi:MAG: methionyl-tRNA formyltransferase [Pseudonocardiaceae bacterium]
MRVATLGFQTWGYRTLQAVLGSSHEVVLAVTHPHSEHAYERIWSDSVAELARAHDVPLHLTSRADDALATRLAAAEPDIMVANNWRTWLPKQIHDLPPRGTLNIHDSLLPAYAGFSPLIWALINGEREVGVTAHLMNDELDAGDIVLQRAVPVGDADTATDLFHRTVELIGPITLDALALIASGRADWTRQDRSRASFFHKRSIEDSRIDWTWPANDIERLIRAQSDPYPNAFTHYRGERIRLLRSRVSTKRYGGTPGRVFIAEHDGMVIVAGADARHGRNHGLVVQRVGTEDGRELDALDYFRTAGGYLTPRR